MVALDLDKLRAVEETYEGLQVIIARAVCKRVSREEIHELVDRMMDRFGGQ